MKQCTRQLFPYVCTHRKALPRFLVPLSDLRTVQPRKVSVAIDVAKVLGVQVPGAYSVINLVYWGPQFNACQGVRDGIRHYGCEYSSTSGIEYL